MPRRARLAFLGAAIGVGAMLLTWYVAHDVSLGRRVDADVLGGFHSLSRPRLDVLTNAVAGLCDPVPFVIWAAVPVAIALLRGRPRVALALAVLLLGANESTEVLKPLLGGARDHVAGVGISDASWPSGHATACMSLALAMVISVPARLRPAVAGAMAAFCVAVVFSFLELGWHYPSDVLGGFEMSSTWALLAVGGLAAWEVHRPTAAAADPSPSVSVAGALAPAALLLGCAVAFGALLLALRPHETLAYAEAHPGFVVGAAAIATLAFACASGMSLVLRVGAVPRRTLQR